VSHDDFRVRAHDALTEFGPRPDEGPWEEFCSRLRFAGGGFSAESPGSLLEVLGDAEREMGGRPQRVHYLAVPPTAFEKLTRGLGRYGLAARSRVVFEKPFGTSLGSFHALDRAVHEVLDESQVFRIDHFLGKEAAQDLYAARFGNGLFSGVPSASEPGFSSARGSDARATSGGQRPDIRPCR
jgi:glucose-6-phosphate 1-dehydrogenase